jgi:DNA-binding XRE family transcriptional regulator
MTRDVNDIIKALPASRRKKIERRGAALIADEMTLQELRRARKLTQERMAEKLHINQKQISEVERRTDMHISTLRRTVQAMGGDLSLVVQFPDRPPVILTGITAID